MQACPRDDGHILTEVWRGQAQRGTAKLAKGLPGELIRELTEALMFMHVALPDEKQLLMDVSTGSTALLLFCCGPGRTEAQLQAEHHWPSTAPGHLTAACITHGQSASSHAFMMQRRPGGQPDEACVY